MPGSAQGKERGTVSLQPDVPNLLHCTLKIVSLWLRKRSLANYVNEKPNLQHFRRKQAHPPMHQRPQSKISSMKSTASSKTSLKNLKPRLDFFRLDEVFLILRVSHFLAVCTELGRINSRLTDLATDLATGNIFILCKGAAHREQANS